MHRPSRYICEGVYFRDSAVSADRVRGKKLRITYYILLANERGVDKRVTLRLALIRGEQIINETIVPDIRVEEGKMSTRSAECVVTPDELTVGPSPQLRITVATKDDD